MAIVRGAGFSSGVSDDAEFDQLSRNLDDAARLGMDFVELPVFAMTLIAGGRILPTQLRRLKETLAGRGLGYTVHGPIAINLMQGPEMVARHMTVAKAAIEVSASIGATHMILHTGHTKDQSEADIDAAFARQREALASLGEIAAANSLIIAVENIFASEPGAYTALPSRLAGEIKAIGHPNIRGCLDFSHAAILCKSRGADYLKEVEAFASVARHLHIHDSFGDPTQLRASNRCVRVAYGLGDLHLPIGWGNLPWQEMMAGLKFEPEVIFNLELPIHYWFALDESVQAMRDMIREYEASASHA